ncbi:hypothetical protein AAG906_012610 [Vitis piasezkii]
MTRDLVHSQLFAFDQVRGLGVGSSIGAISMFGSTMEMMDIRAMKTYIALSWISWIHVWPVIVDRDRPRFSSLNLDQRLEDRWAPGPPLPIPGAPLDSLHLHLHHRHPGLSVSIGLSRGSVSTCFDRVMGWDGYDDLPLDEAQMIMLFPLSLSGAAQRWFASLDHSRHFGSLVQALYGIEEGIARGLWADFSLRLKGKKPGQDPPAAPYRPVGPTYLHPHKSICYKYRAPPPSRSAKRFTLGMPLSRAFKRLVEEGLIAPLLPRPPPHPTPPRFKIDLHCAYHQRVSHDTNNCTMLRHTI